MVTLEEFIERMKVIKAKGYVRTHRKGPTGIGKTLEDLLGIKENNIHRPDFGIYELKASRKMLSGIATQSMITLFTKSPEPKKANTYLLNKYGYVTRHSGGRKILHETLFMIHFTRINNTSLSLKVEADSKKIYIVAKRDDIEKIKEYNSVYWPREILQKRIESKMKNLVYVKANYRGQGENEEFWFNEAYLLSGSSYDKFLELLRSGDICVDIRIGQYPNGKTHDHGTGFRMNKLKLDLLYSKRERLI